MKSSYLSGTSDKVRLQGALQILLNSNDVLSGYSVIRISKQP